MKYQIVILLLLISSIAAGQDQFYSLTRQQKQKQSYRFKKNKKMAAICPGMKLSEYPFQSLGVKIGDPFAISYKLYAHEHLALVMDVGTTAKGLYQNYYTDLFSEFPEYDTLIYANHRVERGLVIQTRAVYQARIKPVEGLDWYLGAGWQWRFTDVRYEYSYEPVPNAPEVGFDTQTLNDNGPEFTAGVEYSYTEFPIVAFFELNYFVGLVRDPALRRVMGGAGLRFRF